MDLQESGEQFSSYNYLLEPRLTIFLGRDSLVRVFCSFLIEKITLNLLQDSRVPPRHFHHMGILSARRNEVWLLEDTNQPPLSPQVFDPMEPHGRCGRTSKSTYITF